MRNTSLLATTLASLAACTGDPSSHDDPEPDVLALPGDAYYPESLHAAADGTLYVGSLASGEVVAFDPGATEARVVINAGAYGVTAVTGVHIFRGELWLCSVDTTFQRANEVRSFSLTGEPGLVIALPPTVFCNDLAFDATGNLYITDSFGGTIQRVPDPTTQVETFIQDPRFVPASMGAFGLDGIVVSGDALIVNKFDTGELFRIELDDKSISEITVTPPLANPDGMRILEDSGALAVIEGGSGRLSRVLVAGDTATSTPLAADLDMPTGVAISGGAAWVTEGQLGRLFAGEAPNLPFAVRRIPL